MTDSLDQFDDEVKPAKLPVFLKVLCILTFVGSGMGILGALMNLLLKGFLEKTANQTHGLYDAMGVNVEEMLRWQMYSNIANLLGSLLCLFGALMMWRLKRVGFYLYVPGNLIPLIVSFFAINHVIGGPFAGFGIAGVALGSIFYFAFIVMYGVNYKHLR